MCQKCEGMGLNGFISKEFKTNYAENMKKIVGAVWDLPANNRRANLAQFGWKWAELAVLFSRQLFGSKKILLTNWLNQ
jgi:hypothetical protein